jgi:hypothetical protein
VEDPALERLAKQFAARLGGAAPGEEIHDANVMEVKLVRQ